MWGREMRAGLVFVIAALLIGQSFRAWERGHHRDLRDIVRELEAQDVHEPAPGAPGESAGSGTVPARTPVAREVPVGRIDPSKASVSELVRLPGIGPSLAGRVVVDRRH